LVFSVIQEREGGREEGGREGEGEGGRERGGKEGEKGGEGAFFLP
jgi:hypothetical protein